MERTDYAAIAPRYDQNPIRHRIPKDTELQALVDGAEKRPLEALDVACGTGNYLAIQCAAFGDTVRWRGLDASEAMLQVASKKLPGIELSLGRAETLPYRESEFDYVTTSFAFHHFEDKPRALDELRRVVRPGGVLRIFNAEPRRMPRSWLYCFFPEAKIDEEKRYWSAELLHRELERRGLETTVRVETTMTRSALARILEDAERRDGSELALLPQRDYERGLARIRDAVARAPEGTIVDEIALVTALARRRK